MIDTAYTIRNYRPEDFNSYVRLCRKAKELVPSGHPAEPLIVSQWLKWPHYTPEKDLFLVEHGRVIVGGMDLRPEPGIGRVILRCWVSPGHRRKGLGRELFQHALERARGLGARYIHVNVPENNITARTALTRYGLTPVREYLELKLDITDLDSQEVDRATRECRYLEPGDEEALADLQNRAFANQWGYNPNTTATISYFTRLGGFSPGRVTFAVSGDKITGYCWTEIFPGGRAGDSPRGIIHMLGTDPDFQARGIGRKALLAGLAYLKRNGVKTAFLSVDSGNKPANALYRSVGFRPYGKTLWYEIRAD